MSDYIECHKCWGYGGEWVTDWTLLDNEQVWVECSECGGSGRICVYGHAIE